MRPSTGAAKSSNATVRALVWRLVPRLSASACSITLYLRRNEPNPRRLTTLQYLARHRFQTRLRRQNLLSFQTTRTPFGSSTCGRPFGFLVGRRRTPIASKASSSHSATALLSLALPSQPVSVAATASAPACSQVSSTCDSAIGGTPGHDRSLPVTN